MLVKNAVVSKECLFSCRSTTPASSVQAGGAFLGRPQTTAVWLARNPSAEQNRYLLLLYGIGRLMQRMWEEATVIVRYGREGSMERVQSSAKNSCLDKIIGYVAAVADAQQNRESERGSLSDWKGRCKGSKTSERWQSQAGRKK